MVVNFKAYKISRGVRKLARTSTLIKKKLNHNKIIKKRRKMKVELLPILLPKSDFFKIIFFNDFRLFLYVNIKNKI
jgi:hypothetical protein